MNLKKENEKLRDLLRRAYNYVPIPDQIRIDSALSQQAESAPAQTEQQPTVKDFLTVQPMAYAVFAANGNVACFSTRRDHPSLVAFEADGHSVVSLAPIAQSGLVEALAAFVALAEEREQELGALSPEMRECLENGCAALSAQGCPTNK